MARNHPKDLWSYIERSNKTSIVRTKRSMQYSPHQKKTLFKIGEEVRVMFLGPYTERGSRFVSVWAPGKVPEIWAEA